MIFFLIKKKKKRIKKNEWANKEKKRKKGEKGTRKRRRKKKGGKRKRKKKKKKKKKRKQVTLGHNIVADRWAGASNSHPNLNTPPHTQTYAKSIQKRSFPSFQLVRFRSTDRWTNGQTKPLIELRVRN